MATTSAKHEKFFSGQPSQKKATEIPGIGSTNGQYMKDNYNIVEVWFIYEITSHWFTEFMAILSTEFRHFSKFKINTFWFQFVSHKSNLNLTYWPHRLPVRLFNKMNMKMCSKITQYIKAIYKSSLLFWTAYSKTQNTSTDQSYCPWHQRNNDNNI